MSKIQVNDVFKQEFSFSQEQVNKFAELTGDSNPLHLDAAYAATTPFKRPIMHGFLGGSVFSRIFGMFFPGEGTIYMRQTMEFMRPMFVDTVYEVIFTVIEANAEKHTATVRTEMFDKTTQKCTIKGEALVMNIEKI